MHLVHSLVGHQTEGVGVGFGKRKFWGQALDRQLQDHRCDMLSAQPQSQTGVLVPLAGRRHTPKGPLYTYIC